MAKVDNFPELSNDSRSFQASAYESGLNTVFSYNGSNVTFRTRDGVLYINATEMAKPFGKRPNDYLVLPSTNQLIEAITRKSGNVDNQLVITIRGGYSPGTWLQEDVALDFAQWLSVDFRLWCNDRIKELLIFGNTSIRRKPIPTITPEEYDLRRAEANNESARILERLLSRTNIPEYHAVINHYIMEKITGNPDAIPLPVCTEKTYTATQIGNMLGVSANRIGKIANTWNLKVPENGKWFYDKSKFSNKEVETFRYNERGLNLLREIIGKEGYANKHRKDREGDIPSCNTLFGD